MTNRLLAWIRTGCALAFVGVVTPPAGAQDSNAEVEQSITRAQNDLRLQDQQRQLDRAGSGPAVQDQRNRLDQLHLQGEQQLQGPLLTGPNAPVEDSISRQQTQLQLQTEQNRIDQLQSGQPLH